MRTAKLHRESKETSIQASIDLDGTGTSNINTGIGFFDHMLDLLAFHSGFDLSIQAKGDLHVCDHHTIEDIGITLGKIFLEALQDKKGIARYGNFFLPMDETLAQVSIDISGRAYLVYHCDLKRDMIHTFSCEMLPEFLRAFAYNANITLHVNVPYGENDHHKVEAIFKALGRALAQAVEITSTKLPSTKGIL